MGAVLLVIDIQNDYFPGGRMELQGSPEAGMKTKEMIELFRKTTMPVVHVQHNSVRPGAKFLLPGTPGAELHENVKPLSHEKVFVKSFPNSFRGTGLDEYLKEKISLNLCLPV